VHYSISKLSSSVWHLGAGVDINKYWTITRPYLPPETIVLDVSNQAIRALCNRLNDTPRKCLGFQTPREMFSRHLLALERQCV
jgi:IS30 family transposase